MTILVKALSQKYPQSVYYTLRAFLLEKREQPDRSSAGAVDSNKLAKATTVRLSTGGTVRTGCVFLLKCVLSVCMYMCFRGAPAHGRSGEDRVCIFAEVRFKRVHVCVYDTTCFPVSYDLS